MSKLNYDAFSVLSRSSGGQAGRVGYFEISESEKLRGTEFLTGSFADKIALFDEILDRKIHGISFSPYIDGQSPGSAIGEDQIRSRLAIIQPYTNWIRSFRCIEGNQAIPRIAHENQLKTMVGIGLTEDLEANEVEITNGIEIARDGYADILAVGNEILLRRDLTEDQLIDYILRVKAEVPANVQVSYVDAYFVFEEYPRVADVCDVILVNCYPFWESCAVEYALFYMKKMYSRATQIAKGKKVIISETGWPTVGTANGLAVPSFENALGYFIATCQWARQEGIEVFYFSSFDETWKVGDEGDVGAYWGLWDKEGCIKYA